MPPFSINLPCRATSRRNQEIPIIGSFQRLRRDWLQDRAVNGMSFAAAETKNEFRHDSKTVLLVKDVLILYYASFLPLTPIDFFDRKCNVYVYPKLFRGMNQLS